MEGSESELGAGKMNTGKRTPAVFAQVGWYGLFPDEGELFKLGVLNVCWSRLVIEWESQLIEGVEFQYLH